MVSLELLLIVAITVLGGLLSLGIAWYAWQRSEVVSSRWFAVLMGTIGLWGFAQSVLYLSPSAEMAAIAIRVVGLLGIPIPVIWLIWAATFTGSDEWLSRPVLGVLFGEVLVSIGVILSAPLHGYRQYSITMQTQGGVTLPVSTYHSVASWQWAVSLLLVLCGMGLLVRYFIRARRAFQPQVGLIIGGALLPFLASILFVEGIGLHPGLDLTTLSSTVYGLVIAYALFRHDFLEIAPLAEDIVLNELPDPVLVIDAEGSVVDHNAAAAELVTGRGPDEPPDVETLMPGLESALDTQEPVRLSAETSPTGSPVVYAPIASEIVDERGINRGRLLVLRDVTVQKRRQETLEELHAATNEFMQAGSRAEIAAELVETVERVLEHRYTGVFGPTPESDRFSALALSDAITEIVGDETISLSADQTTEVKAIEDVTVFSQINGHVILGEADILESALVVPLGEHGVLGIGSDAPPSAFTEADRRFAKIIGLAAESAMDRAAREQELAESEQLLQRRTEQIEFLNSILQHDVLNAITAIKGKTYDLEGHVAAEAEENLEIIDTWLDDIQELTQKVRRLSDATKEGFQSTIEAIDLHEVVEPKVGKIDETYDEVTLTVALDDCTVRSGDLLGQIVENLVLNAIEHNDGPDQSVDISTDPGEETVELRVADNGPGIPADQREDVFDPEVTSDTSHTYGFGLYFVKSMAEAYGGDVWFEESEDGGAAAVLELRRATAQ